MDRGTVVVAFFSGAGVPPWGTTPLRVAPITDIPAATNKPIDEGQEHWLRFKEGYHPVVILEYLEDTTLAEEAVRVFASHTSDMVNLEKRGARQVASRTKMKSASLTQPSHPVGPLPPVVEHDGSSEIQPPNWARPRERNPVEMMTSNTDDSHEPFHLAESQTRKRTSGACEASGISGGSPSGADGRSSKKPCKEDACPMPHSPVSTPCDSSTRPVHFFEVSTQTSRTSLSQAFVPENALQTHGSAGTVVIEAGELLLSSTATATRSLVQPVFALIKLEEEPEIDFQQIGSDNETEHQAQGKIEALWPATPSIPCVTAGCNKSQKCGEEVDHLLGARDLPELAVKKFFPSRQSCPADYFKPMPWEPSLAEVKHYTKVYGEKVIRCTCGIFREDSTMTQCDECKSWQHCNCVGGHVAAKNAPYQCYRCAPRPVDREIHQNLPYSSSNPYNRGWFVTLLVPNCQNFYARVGDCVFLTKDRKPPVAGVLYDPVAVDILRIHKMWRESNGTKWLVGNHYLRPYEDGRSFYENELVQSHRMETVRMEAVLGRCCIMDCNMYARGRPKEYPRHHCFICDFKVGKGSSQLVRLNSRDRVTQNFAQYYFQQCPEKLPVRRA